MSSPAQERSGVQLASALMLLLLSLSGKKHSSRTDRCSDALIRGSKSPMGWDLLSPPIVYVCVGCRGLERRWANGCNTRSCRFIASVCHSSTRPPIKTRLLSPMIENRFVIGYAPHHCVSVYPLMTAKLVPWCVAGFKRDRGALYKNKYWLSLRT